jgi:hypothetical protein
MYYRTVSKVRNMPILLPPSSPAITIKYSADSTYLTMASQLSSPNDFRPPLSKLSCVSFSDGREAQNESLRFAYQPYPPDSAVQAVYERRRRDHASAKVPVIYEPGHWAPLYRPTVPSKSEEKEKGDAMEEDAMEEDAMEEDTKEEDKEVVDPGWQSEIEETTAGPSTRSYTSASEINEAATGDGDPAAEESESSDFETEIQRACSDVITLIEKGDVVTAAWPNRTFPLVLLKLGAR